MGRILEKIFKYGLRLFVFLFPLWFLPLTISPLNINKQMFLAAFVFGLLLLWIIKVFIEGKTRFISNKLNFAILIFLGLSLISAFFSYSKPQSFWGMNFEFDAFFSFVLYGILFFLFANLVKKEEISKIIWVFVLSAEILSLLFIVQLFKPVFPLGAMSSLAIFLAAAVSVVVSRVDNNLAFKKSLINWLLVMLPLAVLFLINYWQAWLMVVIAMGVIVFIKLKNSSARSSDNPLKPVFLPLFILLLAAVFLFIKLPTEKIVNLTPEIVPTYKATLEIAAKTLKSGPKDFIIGSGPGTFIYQYSLYRKTDSNVGDFWQVRFNQGAASAPTFLATLGILGFLSFLFIIALFFWQAIKKNEMDLEILVMGLIFIISLFLFPADIVVLAFVFLVLGLWVSASIKEEKGEEKELFSSQSPQKTFLVMGLCLILIICSIWTVYNFSQKYAAAIIYAKGINLINSENPKLDQGIIEINNAASLDQKDSYFRNLSQAIIFKINEVLNNSGLSDEQKKNALQKLVSDAETTASAAVGVNPTNSQNWLQLGTVYENFASINIGGADELAVSNYQKAFGLDPQNPLIPFNIARVYISAAKKIKTKGEEYKKYLDLALENSQKAISLKNDFLPAYSLMEEIQKMR